MARRKGGRKGKRGGKGAVMTQMHNVMGAKGRKSKKRGGKSRY